MAPIVFRAMSKITFAALCVLAFAACEAASTQTSPTPAAASQTAKEAKLIIVVPITVSETKGKPQSRYLVIHDVVTESPGGAYNVYVGLPAGKTPGGVDDPSYVGTFSMYDAQPGSPLNVSVPLVKAVDLDAPTTPERELLTIVSVGPDAPISAKGAELIRQQ